MSAPPALLQPLRQLLGDASLVAERLPGTDLTLWLIDAQNMDRAFSPEETRRILDEPPYWCFCWASGLAMARWLVEQPHWVQGKRVLDFGAGSGLRMGLGRHTRSSMPVDSGARLASAARGAAANHRACTRAGLCDRNAGNDGAGRTGGCAVSPLLRKKSVKHKEVLPLLRSSDLRK